MINTILGRKIGMTQVWNEKDEVVPVTVIQAGPCAVSQVKTVESDGYCAVQIGFGDIKEKNVTKPMKGHFAKAGVKPVRYLREVRVPEGEGFQGTVKRHNFNSGPTTHGSHFHRTHGSVGQCSTPSRIHKGVKMPGHMGDERVTVRNLEVVRIDEEQTLILVKGAVPGAKNGLVIVRMA